MRLVVFHDHVVNELVGQLAQDFQGQLSLPQILEVLVLHQLYDVPDSLVTLLVREHLSVCI